MNFLPLPSHFQPDPRFPADHKVILHFNSGSPAENRGFVFQSPLVRIEPANTLAHTDSLENINEGESIWKVLTTLRNYTPSSFRSVVIHPFGAHRKA